MRSAPIIHHSANRHGPTVIAVQEVLGNGLMGSGRLHNKMETRMIESLDHGTRNRKPREPA